MAYHTKSTDKFTSTGVTKCKDCVKVNNYTSGFRYSIVYSVIRNMQPHKTSQKTNISIWLHNASA